MRIGQAFDCRDATERLCSTQGKLSEVLSSCLRVEHCAVIPGTLHIEEVLYEEDTTNNSAPQRHASSLAISAILQSNRGIHRDMDVRDISYSKADAGHLLMLNATKPCSEGMIKHMAKLSSLRVH